VAFPVDTRSKNRDIGMGQVRGRTLAGKTRREEMLATVKESSRAVKIREARLTDYAQIAALEARNGLETKPQQEWEHLWRNNPVFGRLADWPIGWVVENENGEIVGAAGNLPVSYILDGREIIAAGGRAFVADPSYRSYAASLVRRFIHQKHAELLLVSSANSNSAPLLYAMRFSHVPSGTWDQSSFWITNHRGLMASALQKKRLPSFIGYALLPLLRLKDAFTRKPRRTTCDLTICPEFDDRFDQFWAELKRTRPVMLANRSRETLAWHFKFALEQNRAWIVAVSDGWRLLAYYLRHDKPELGLTRVRLVDFQTLHASTEFLEPMLSWALQKCRDQGIHMLEAYGFSPEKQAMIDSLSPHHRRFPAWTYFYNARNPELATQLKDPMIWDPSHFDGDASI